MNCPLLLAMRKMLTKYYRSSSSFTKWVDSHSFKPDLIRLKSHRKNMQTNEKE